MLKLFCICKASVIKSYQRYLKNNGPLDIKKYVLFAHSVKSVQIWSFFWSVFSCIWTEYGQLLCTSPCWVKIQENTDQEKLLIWTPFMQWHVFEHFRNQSTFSNSSLRFRRILQNQPKISNNGKILLSLFFSLQIKSHTKNLENC